MNLFRRLRDLRKRLGAMGEADARALLRSKGYVILAANYRTKRGEIDIVARDGMTLVFVEVKTRHPNALYRPEANWSLRQQSNLRHVAQVYMRRIYATDLAYRFELVEVRRSRWFLHTIRHRQATMPDLFSRHGHAQMVGQMPLSGVL